MPVSTFENYRTGEKTMFIEPYAVVVLADGAVVSGEEIIAKGKEPTNNQIVAIIEPKWWEEN